MCKSNNKKQQQMLMFLLAPFSVHHLFPTLCTGPLAKLSACADGRTLLQKLWIKW
jgi:hypothetical protein